mgnify:CR=1 FL=1
MATYKGIQGYTVQKLSDDPTASEASGQLWYNSTSGAFKISTEGAGAWSSGTAAPGAVNQAGGAGITTAFLMWGGSPITANSFKYDGTTWTATNSLNLGIAGSGAVGTQTAALGAGGYNPSLSPAYTNAAEEFDGTCWASVNADTNKTLMGYIGLTGIQTAALSVGGYGPGPGYVSTCSEYDGTNWTAANAYPSPTGSVFALGTQTAAVAMGGQPSYGTSGSDYDGTSWSAGDSINTGRAEGQAGGINTAGIIAGGASPTLQAVTEKYDGTSWTEVGDLATARSLPANGYSNVAAATSSFIVATGGDGTPVKSTAVEEWTDPVYTIKTVTVS